jgi:hypothetical protein
MKAGRRQLIRTLSSAVHKPEKFSYFPFSSGWTGDLQWLAARIAIQIINEEKGQPGAVITVQMAQKNDV